MDEEIRHISKPKGPPLPVFLSAVVVIFFLTLSTADSVGFVPYYIDGSLPASELTPTAEIADTASQHIESPADTTPAPIALAEPEVSLADLPVLGDPLATATKLHTPPPAPKPVTPTRIVIDDIGLDLSLQNTQSRNLATLDAALEKGPVRYMDSALLNESGNMLIFAHSSHLPIVHNKMFQAFNRLPELKSEDVISIYGADGKQYLYSVTSVHKADATDTLIDISDKQGTKLTLVTCDTLTSKSSRFIVEANFIGTADVQ